MAVAGIGKAKIGKAAGGTGVYAKSFKLVSPKPGETSTAIYRLLPPIKGMAQSGTWSKFYSVHYGYAVPNPNDPTQTSQRPFVCVQKENFRTKEVIQECAACQNEQEKAKALKEAEDTLEANGHSEEEIKTACAMLAQEKRRFNSDRKDHIHVMSAEGEFGTLKLSRTNYKKLLMEIEELAALGIDCFSPEEGVWFKFDRTGSKVRAIDVISVVRDSVGRGASQIRPAPLSDEQLTKALEILPDLSELYTIISPQQVQQLVDAEGDPEKIEEIFNQGSTGRKFQARAATPPVNSARTRVREMAEEVDEDEESPEPVPVARDRKQEVARPSAPDQERAAMQKEMEELKAKLERMSAAVPVVPAAAAQATPPPSAPKPQVGQVAVKKPTPAPSISEKDALDLGDDDLAQMFPGG